MRGGSSHGMPCYLLKLFSFFRIFSPRLLELIFLMSQKVEKTNKLHDSTELFSNPDPLWCNSDRHVRKPSVTPAGQVANFSVLKEF